MKQSETSPSGRVHVVSELYYPEETSTGHVMTTIAEGMADQADVSVICAQPSYSKRGTTAPASEVRNGVNIKRVRSTSLDPHSLPKKAVNYASVTASCAWTTVRSLRRNDHVVVVTNPPLLPFAVVAAARLRGARSSVIVHDLYPDVLVPAGVLSSNALIYRLLQWLTARLFTACDDIVAVGQDQAERIRSKLPASHHSKVRVIRQAADLQTVTFQSKQGNEHLRSLGLDDPEKIVIQFAGNIGPLQNIEELIGMIERCQHLADVHFLFFGEGRSRLILEESIESRGLSNATVRPPVARSDSDEMHAASDVALVALSAGMKGISVPSRIGNALASGRPLLAFAEAGSELHTITETHNVGWWTPTGDHERFVQTIEDIVERKSELPTLQARAREVAERYYALDQMVAHYNDLITTDVIIDLDAPDPTPAEQQRAAL